MTKSQTQANLELQVIKSWPADLPYHGNKRDDIAQLEDEVRRLSFKPLVFVGTEYAPGVVI